MPKPSTIAKGNIGISNVADVEPLASKILAKTKLRQVIKIKSPRLRIIVIILMTPWALIGNLARMKVTLTCPL